jgi:hypothetical protein
LKLRHARQRKKQTMTDKVKERKKMQQATTILQAASCRPPVSTVGVFALGLGQGLVLVTGGILGGSLVRLSKLAPYRVGAERLLVIE